MKKKKLSKLKSGQFPDWMTQVTLGSGKKKKKKITGRTPLEAYAFDARFGKRSVFILDPRLTFYLVISDLWSADCSV